MKAFTFTALAAVSLATAGCVERELFITSEPEGALVYVNAVEKGRTPTPAMPFTWYGDYDIILRLDGHETLKTHASIMPRWYEVPPLDLLSELAPWTYRDRRELSFKMKELVLPSDEELIERAEELKAKNLQPVAGEAVEED